MKVKVAVKSGRYELVPITKEVSLKEVKKMTPDECIPEEDVITAELLLENSDIVFLVCDTRNDSVAGFITCKAEEKTVTLQVQKFNGVSNKDFCSLIYYASQWIFNFTDNIKALLPDGGLDKEVIARLRVLEFRKSEQEGYLQREFPDTGPTATILAVLNCL